MYNETHFREHKAISPTTLVLTPEILTATATLNNPKTLVPTSLNITMNSPININGGIIIRFRITFGQIVCSALTLGSNLVPININACTTTELTINTSQ